MRSRIADFSISKHPAMPLETKDDSHTTRRSACLKKPNAKRTRRPLSDNSKTLRLFSKPIGRGDLLADSRACKATNLVLGVTLTPLKSGIASPDATIRLHPSGISLSRQLSSWLRVIKPETYFRHGSIRIEANLSTLHHSKVEISLHGTLTSPVTTKMLLGEPISNLPSCSRGEPLLSFQRSTCPFDTCQIPRHNNLYKKFTLFNGHCQQQKKKLSNHSCNL